MKSILTTLQEYTTFSSPARNTSDAALSDGQVVLSYGELIAQVREWTDFLQAEKPKCVALYADNSPQWVIVDLACQAAEIPFVPLPLFFPRDNFSTQWRFVRSI